jgi:hypothetical protein
MGNTVKCIQKASVNQGSFQEKVYLTVFFNRCPLTAERPCQIQQQLAVLLITAPYALFGFVYQQLQLECMWPETGLA